MTRPSRPSTPVAAEGHSARIPQQRRPRPTAQSIVALEHPNRSDSMDGAGDGRMGEPLVLTRTILPVQGWWRDVEPAPTSLPPGYVAARRPVVAGPDGDELRVRAWLRWRLGGAA
ncbi:hypothetical protein [Streptomyces hygroscopicus]|uniref:hypothetical protein n=1 Tax=Streptomyces hygroscopicus TaxID=1912 RepID=UPI001FCAADDF|nr:hypothetical protein [Streptomyces hygroscopicus]BDH16222.1 hypothetical protein HOK021_74010 [Streptomyces hygroscopicus]